MRVGGSELPEKSNSYQHSGDRNICLNKARTFKVLSQYAVPTAAAAAAVVLLAALVWFEDSPPPQKYSGPELLKSTKIINVPYIRV
jgi:hypothetical protein